MIEVTDKAKDYLLQATGNNNSKYATFTVKGGGCSGFTYEWKFANDKDDGEDWIEVPLSDSSQNKLLIEVFEITKACNFFDETN